MSKSNWRSFCCLLLLSVIVPLKTIGQVEIIRENVPWQGRIASSQDKKYYQIEITGTEPLFVHLDKPSSWSSEYTIYRGSLNSNAVGISGWSNSDQMVQVENVIPGTYYIVVDGGEGDFSLTVRRGLDELYVNQGESGQVRKFFDLVWYQIEITGTEPLFVHLDKSSSWSSEYTIYRGSLNSNAVGISGWSNS
ncbi:hypothetical protein JW948_15555, partial [bacterium]|nr:hypothetical protein [bacterium]